MKPFYILLVFFCCIKQIYSQSISGRLLDSLNLPIEFSPVALLVGKDSSIYKGVITDASGLFFFDKIIPGSYVLKFEIIGYEKKYGPPIKIDTSANIQLPVIGLKGKKENNLDEISVSTLHKTVEFKNGNIIVNIANSALAAGNTAYDLLAKLPGVALNEEGISIQGREGVKVMINDRVQQLSYRQLINLLKGISSASIEKIEVLKNPPIKYDASGTAGLINIRTKKVKITGFSGSANTSGSQGFYPRGESSFSLNYKSKRMVFFTDFSSEYGKYISVNNFDRFVSYNSITTELNQKHIETERDRGFQTNIGLDWQLNKRNIIGCNVTIGPGWANDDTDGNNFLSDSTLGYDLMKYSYSMDNIWNYMNYNINAEHVFDTLGNKLTFSADYSPNWDEYTGNFNHRFLFNNDEVLKQKIFKTFSREDMTMLSSKLDLETNLSKSTALQAGVKGTQQRFSRNYLFKSKDNKTGNYINDTSFSNNYKYIDQVLAAYLNLEQEFDNLEISAGVRAENTVVRINSPGKDLSVSQNYFNVFPVVSMEFEPGEKHNFELSYNKRINRPDFFSFYPYKIFWTNIFVTDRGNPNLVPEYSNTLEFTHVYKGKFSNAIAYSRITNFITNNSFQNDSTKEMVVLIANMKSSETLGYTFFWEYKVRNWWILSCNLTLSYLHFQGEINDLDYSSSGYSSNGLLRSEFVTGKGSKLEVAGQYVGPQPLGIFVVQPRWALNLAFKQKLFKEKLDLVIGIDDIFYTMIGRNHVSFQNQKWKVSETNDTRRFRISLSYNFGKIKVERRDVNSNEEEKEKLKN